jgi:hypothetical protein
MQLILESDEASSLMTVITSFVIDRSGISQDANQAVRRWRSEHEKGSPSMDDLAVAMNEAIGAYIDDRTNRMIRRKGRYIRAREPQ